MCLLLCYIYLGACLVVVLYLNGSSCACCFIVFFVVMGMMLCHIYLGACVVVVLYCVVMFFYVILFLVVIWVVVLCHIVFVDYVLVVVSYNFRYIFS
jgi:hypothetical protein